MSNDWLQKLKPGDMVCVQDLKNININKVERITDTQIILGQDKRFSKRTGLREGSYMAEWLIRLTAKRFDKALKERDMSNLKDRIISKLNTADIDKLSMVWKILSEEKK